MISRSFGRTDDFGEICKSNEQAINTGVPDAVPLPLTDVMYVCVLPRAMLSGF